MLFVLIIAIVAGVGVYYFKYGKGSRYFENERGMVFDCNQAYLNKSRDIRPTCYYYEPFDGNLRQMSAVVTPQFVPGKYGLAAKMLWQNGVKAEYMPLYESATIMAWVRTDDVSTRSVFWWNDRQFPNAVYFPDRECGLSVYFSVFNPGAASFRLASTMKKGRFYHIAQSWGAEGYRAYLDGRLVHSDSENIYGLRGYGGTANPCFHFGTAPSMPATDEGSIWNMNQNGIIMDDFAFFSGQVNDTAIKHIAESQRSLQTSGAEEQLQIPVIFP